MAFTFIMQNIAANLGGMLTPFGNPQNLYIYSYYNIPTWEFCKIMFPAFALAVTLLVVACLPIKATKFNITEEFPEKLNVKKTVLYCALFLLSILIVFRVIPFIAGLIIIPVALFFEVGKTSIGAKELVNLTFFIENSLNVNPDKIFIVYSTENDLAHKRLDYICNLLHRKYGIALERIVNGGVIDNYRYSDINLNRVVIIQ